MRNLTDALESSISTFLHTSQQKLFSCLNPPNVSNKPITLPDQFTQLWMPNIQKNAVQTDESFNEQAVIIDSILGELSSLIRSNASGIQLPT